MQSMRTGGAYTRKNVYMRAKQRPTCLVTKWRRKPCASLCTCCYSSHNFAKLELNERYLFDCFITKLCSHESLGTNSNLVQDLKPYGQIIYHCASRPSRGGHLVKRCKPANTMGMPLPTLARRPRWRWEGAFLARTPLTAQSEWRGGRGQ